MCDEEVVIVRGWCVLLLLLLFLSFRALGCSGSRIDWKALCKSLLNVYSTFKRRCGSQRTILKRSHCILFLLSLSSPSSLPLSLLPPSLSPFLKIFLPLLFLSPFLSLSLRQVDEALQHSEEIESLVGNLSSCEYEVSMFTEVLEQIQKLVDNLNLRSYTNLSHWVAKLDQRVSFQWQQEQRRLARMRRRRTGLLVLLHT